VHYREMTRSKICVWAMLIFLCAGCGNIAKMAEDIVASNEALKKKAGVENVSINVRNAQMAVSAQDPSFMVLDGEEKKAKARKLGRTALDVWTAKWPISDVTVYLSYSNGEHTSSDSYSFKAADLRSEPEPGATPAATSSPTATLEASPTP
jgi:uncharacterized metal-binding protein